LQGQKQHGKCRHQKALELVARAPRGKTLGIGKQRRVALGLLEFLELDGFLAFAGFEPQLEHADRGDEETHAEENRGDHSGDGFGEPGQAPRSGRRLSKASQLIRLIL
jgi:hypothetical protein